VALPDKKVVAYVSAIDELLIDALLFHLRR
jgi:hypothetical protein